MSFISHQNGKIEDALKSVLIYLEHMRKALYPPDLIRPLREVKETKQAEGDDGEQRFEAYSNSLELGESEVSVPYCPRVLGGAGCLGFLSVKLSISRFGKSKVTRCIWPA